MGQPLPDAALDQLFRQARTYNAWSDKPVPEPMIRALYDMLKMGPTSANQSPGRFLFLRSKEAKEKLAPFLSGGNRDKTMQAPVVAIIATDTKFYEHLPRLFPHNPQIKNYFSAPPAAAEHGFRNGTLQGAYLILAARSLGLDCGPMSGFDVAGVDNAFLAPYPDTKDWKSNFLCSIGYGTEENLFPRLPRLEFEEACRLL
jgi:3-hydroxypropanoate dehydrogenase